MLSLISVSSLPSPGTAAKAPSTRINSSTTSDNQPHRQVSVLCLLRCRPQCPDSGEVVVARHTHPTHTHTCLCLLVTFLCPSLSCSVAVFTCYCIPLLQHPTSLGKHVFHSYIHYFMYSTHSTFTGQLKHCLNHVLYFLAPGN